jgi:hypothetical protein
MIEDQKLAGIRIKNLREEQLRTLARLLDVNGHQELSVSDLRKKIRRRQQQIISSWGLRKPTP